MSRRLRAWRRSVNVGQQETAVLETWQCRSNPPIALSRVAVAPRSGFLYNRIQKNANSSLITLVHYLETGRSDGVIASRRSVSHLIDWPTGRLVELADLPRMVVIRSPYSRTLSAFLNKVGTARFRGDVGTMLEPTPEGFSQFLRVLDNGSLTLNSHWDLQIKSMLFRTEGYTDIIRFERLETELARFLDKVGIDPDMMYSSGAFKKGRTHSTNAKDLLSQYYDDAGIAIVQRLFQKDFEELGYNIAAPGHD